MTLKHEFVDKMPDSIEEGVIYISIPFETVIHKCCCGCGSEVVTPLSPADWSVTFNGESISLEPSHDPLLGPQLKETKPVTVRPGDKFRDCRQ